MKAISRITVVQLFMLVAASALAAKSAGASSLDTQGTSASLRCPGNAISLTGFDVTPNRRVYDFEGTCWYDSSADVATNEMLKYKVAASFEAPNQGKEVITLVMGTPAIPKGTTYTIRFNSNLDPWLADNAPCTNRSIAGPDDGLKAILTSWPYPVTRGALTEGDRLGITYALLGALNIDIQQPTPNRVFENPDQVIFIGKLNLPDEMDLPANTVMVFKVWTRGWPQPGVETKEFLKFQKVTPMGYANIPVKDIPPGDWWVQARILGKESKFWSNPIPFGIKGADQEVKSFVRPKMLIPTAPLIRIAKPGQAYGTGKKIPFNVKHGLGEKLTFDIQQKKGTKWSPAKLPLPQVSTPKGGASTVESRALFLVSTPGQYRMRVKTDGDGAKWSIWQKFEVTSPGQIRKTRAPAEVEATGQNKLLKPAQKIEIKPATPAAKLKPTKPTVIQKPAVRPKPAAPAVESQ